MYLPRVCQWVQLIFKSLLPWQDDFLGKIYNVAQLCCSFGLDFFFYLIQRSMFSSQQVAMGLCILISTEHTSDQ